MARVPRSNPQPLRQLGSPRYEYGFWAQAATAVYNGISRAGESGHHDARTPAAPPESDRGLSAVDLGPPAAWDRQAYAPARAPPVLGEHTDEVLTEAGFSSGEIETMRNNKII